MYSIIKADIFTLCSSSFWSVNNFTWSNFESCVVSCAVSTRNSVCSVLCEADTHLTRYIATRARFTNSHRAHLCSVLALTLQLHETLPVFENCVDTRAGYSTLYHSCNICSKCITRIDGFLLDLDVGQVQLVREIPLGALLGRLVVRVIVLHHHLHHGLRFQDHVVLVAFVYL